jgi:hypothetical protein
MKNFASVVLIAGLIITAAFSFKNGDSGSLIGTVNPSKAASMAWIMSGTDTLRASMRETGFEFSGVKPGVYSILIVAIAPYKNARRDNITVNDGNVTNVGEIQLIQ